MNNDTLSQIKETLSEATPGPWEWKADGSNNTEDGGYEVFELYHPMVKYMGTIVLSVERNKHGYHTIATYNMFDAQIIANSVLWLQWAVERIEELEREKEEADSEFSL